MSKIDSIKKNNELLSLSFIDIIKNIFSEKNSNKYLETFIRMIKNQDMFKKETGSDYYRDILRSNYELECGDTFIEKKITSVLLECFIEEEDDLITFRKFIDYNERKLVKNNDLTTYKSFQDITNSVNIIDLKYTNNLENEVIKIYENDEYIIVKPLTHNASRKYGAGTKWCTTMKDEHHYFEKYSQQGILIYTINKNTGHKIATYKNLSPDNTIEFSFWDQIDNRIDSMESNLPYYILDVIKEHTSKYDKPNVESGYYSHLNGSDYIDTDVETIEMVNHELARLIQNHHPR